MISIKSDFGQPARKLAAPLLLAAACWAYLLTGAGMGMTIWAMTTPQFPPPTNLPPPMPDWSVGYWLTTALMWWVMMLAMMIPGTLLQSMRQVSPKIETFGRFIVGYAIVWLVFSLIMTVLQYISLQAGLLHGMTLWSVSTGYSLSLVLAAGAYQFLPFKTVVLKPRFGLASASTDHFRGARYGVNCVISTAPMMLLLFVGGVMNLYWIIGLTAVVIAEKTVGTPTVFRAFGILFGLLALRIGAVA